VRKAITNGRITVLADGTIDPDAARAEWHRSTDPARNAVRTDGAHCAHPSAGIETDADARDAVQLIRRVLVEEGAAVSGAILDFNQVRTAETIIKARERQFNMDLKAGRLLDADTVEREWGEQWRKVRAELMSVPSLLRQLIGHLSAADVQVIDRVIRDRLTDLASELG
jgi:hypothetical protein